MKAFHTYITRKDDFTFCYYDKDHLGNVRQVTELDGTSKGDVIQKNNYYPFGAEFCENLAKSSVQSRKYNGKEFDNMHGLNTYDYGARQYNPVTARWDRVDPLAHEYYGVSPYVYCHNNPIMRIDPNGKDDYRFDAKTGIFTLMEKNDETTDRICGYNYDKKTDSYQKNNGFFSSKVLMDNIEKGILKDGVNMKDKNLLISVGGKDEPSVQGVKDFVLGFSELIGREISGLGYSADGSGAISDIVVGAYKNNKPNESSCSDVVIHRRYMGDFKQENVYLDFHTHPDGKLGATESCPDFSKDVRRMRNMQHDRPNASYIILYRPSYKMEEYNYTE